MNSTMSTSIYGAATTWGQWALDAFWSVKEYLVAAPALASPIYSNRATRLARFTHLKTASENNDILDADAHDMLAVERLLNEFNPTDVLSIETSGQGASCIKKTTSAPPQKRQPLGTLFYDPALAPVTHCADDNDHADTVLPNETFTAVWNSDLFGAANSRDTNELATNVTAYDLDLDDDYYMYDTDKENASPVRAESPDAGRDSTRPIGLLSRL